MFDGFFDKYFCQVQKERWLKMSITKHPSYYNDGKKLETWDWIEKGMTDEMFKGGMLGNCLKYLHRHEDKGEEEDLKKAKEYIDKLTEFQYGEKNEKSN